VGGVGVLNACLALQKERGCPVGELVGHDPGRAPDGRHPGPLRPALAVAADAIEVRASVVLVHQEVRVAGTVERPRDVDARCVRKLVQQFGSQQRLARRRERP
jgi:hypothetical protein